MVMLKRAVSFPSLGRKPQRTRKLQRSTSESQEPYQTVACWEVEKRANKLLSLMLLSLAI